MNCKERETLVQKCREIRRLTIESIASLGFGHVGGSLSIVEALVVLYYKHMNIQVDQPDKADRDRFILSKGHSGPALYAVLADKGYFAKEHLLTLNKPETILPSHCDMNSTPGVDMTTGSLGQGFSCAVGLAIGAKMKHYDSKIYVAIGDGESQEGQIWEAAMLAGAKKLDNLIAFLDYNKMQLDGLCADVVEVAPLDKKWEAFQWNVISVEDGNDVAQIDSAIEKAKECRGKPTMIILNTIKGLGASFAIRAGYGNHSMPVTQEMLQEALQELA